MRTTLDFNDALLAEAKAAAAQEHTSLTRLIDEGLVLRLRPAAARRHPPAAASVRRQRRLDGGSVGLFDQPGAAGRGRSGGRNMMPDVNVLIAASRSDHSHHAPALAWLDGALDACGRGRTLAVLPMVAAGFLRLVTHRKIFVQPTPFHAARQFLCAVTESPGVEMPRLGAEWSILLALCEPHELPGNDIPDA